MLRLATLSSALLVFGCANQGDEGMVVINNSAILGTECMLTSGTEQPFLPSGQIFALSPDGYTLSPLIQSRIAKSTSPGSTGNTQQDLLQRTINLRGADVRLTLKASSIETGGAYSVDSTVRPLDEFGVLFSGSVGPEASANVLFEVMTPAQMRNILSMTGVNLSTSNLRAQVLAEVTIRGELGGDEVRSTPFSYPITVCTDCVVVNNGACPLTVSAPRLGNACNPFQDGVVDCCVDASGALVCPGPTM